MVQNYFIAIGDILSRFSWLLLCVVAGMLAILLVWMIGSYLKDLRKWHKSQKNDGDAK